jgi:hypothetical protein
VSNALLLSSLLTVRPHYGNSRNHRFPSADGVFRSAKLDKNTSLRSHVDALAQPAQLFVRQLDFHLLPTVPGVAEPLRLRFRHGRVAGDDSSTGASSTIATRTNGSEAMAKSSFTLAF